MDRVSVPVTAAAPATSRGNDTEGRARAVLHVDLDGARHIFQLHGWQWEGRSDPVYDTGVPRVLDFLDENVVRATFFVIAEDLEDGAKAALVRAIVNRGHDVASHALTHAPLRNLAPERKRREIFESRVVIERELGIAPAGFRAPNFSIDAQSLQLVAEAGYAWDSSVMAGTLVPDLSADAWPMSAEPNRPLQDRALLELPLPAHRPLPFPWHPSYGLVLGFRYFNWGVSRFQRTGSPLVLLFHLIDFADPLPPERVAGWAQRLYTLSHVSGAKKREACGRMLERVRHSYEIVETTRLLDDAREMKRETS